MYNFKMLQELGWGLAVAAGLYVAQLAIAFEPETVQDWQTYIVAGVGGLVRVLGGALLASLRPNG